VLDGRRQALHAAPASAATPGIATQTQTMAEPLRSSGTPMAAASLISPVPISRPSISLGPVRLPETFSVSSERPTMKYRPSSSCRM
jgi:hypothetical protein